MIVATLALLGSAPLGTQAALQPTGKWSVSNKETQCVASRVYGDPGNALTLSIALSPIYGIVRIAVSSDVPASEGMGNGAIAFDGGPAMKVPYGHVGTKAPRETWFSADTSILPKMAAAGIMTLQSDGAPVALELGSGVAMVAALRDCGERLTASWGVQPGAPTALGQAQAISGNMAEWFRDYASLARQTGAEGPAAAILAIGKHGVPTRCSTIRSTGNADLDSTICAIASRRLRTRPPVDADGKPAFGWYVLPVRWAS